MPIEDIFNDDRFCPTSRSRYQAVIDGRRIGVVVAWRNNQYDNHALNKDDIDRLLDLKRDGTFAEAFVVSARGPRSIYVSHRDAEQLFKELKSVSPRSGPYGEYWLLREDLSLREFAPAHDDAIPF
jgi:hypothetical protein